MYATDLQVMSHPPFDPTTDVRITHTVHQARAGPADRYSAGGGLILNHYLRGPSVGKGQHGTVYKCWDLAQSSVEVVRHSSSSFPFFSFLNQGHLS
jgi:[calcium/calmodulin-dependent protein kinase] kinase